ncbi:MAG: hypothetical protein WC638_00070 [Candidatus Paceibacterota bacterium]
MKKITRAALILTTLLAPSFAFAASGYLSYSSIDGCDVYICWLGGMILNIINSVLVPVLFAIAFIVFLYGIAKAYIFSYGDTTKVAEGHHLVLWGIVAFAIMISIWGLVNVVANTFGLSGYYAPPLPTSY